MIADDKQRFYASKEVLRVDLIHTTCGLGGRLDSLCCKGCKNPATSVLIFLWIIPCEPSQQGRVDREPEGIGIPSCRSF